MKKYTIKDNQGNKKTIYANSLSDAIKLNDYKVKDSMSSSEISEAIDNIADKYDGFYSRTYDKVFKDLKAKYPSLKYEEVKQAIEQYADNSSSANAQLRIAKKYFSDSIHDEASLATSINALVTDEKAAIDAYNVAISNLDGKIDENAKQVLVNIMKDERKHIENLYAILNNQVTEKNLKDSIHDAVKSPSAYVDTRLVKNTLPNDLMAEGLKNDYSFNDVLKNFDAISSKILDVVKDALDEAKKDIIDFKRNYINALIN